MWQAKIYNMDKEEETNVVCFSLEDLSTLIKMLQENDNLWLVSVEENFVRVLDEYRKEVEGEGIITDDGIE